MTAHCAGEASATAAQQLSIRPPSPNPHPSFRGPAHLDDGALRGGGPLQGLHHQPAALVVLDVRADLADDLRVAEGVQIVVLNLRAYTLIRINVDTKIYFTLLHEL